MQTDYRLNDLIEQIPTERLDSMLISELNSKNTDGNVVRMILHELKRRDDNCNIDLDDFKDVFDRYSQDIPANTKRFYFRSTILVRIAVVLLCFTIFWIVLPSNVDANSFFERIIHISESYFSYNDAEQTIPIERDYLFLSKNAELQKLYESIACIGISNPVVPTWIPDDCTLTELNTISFPNKIRVYAQLQGSSGNIIYQVDLYNDSMIHDYWKDNTAVRVIEFHGIPHSVMQNNDMLLAVWTTDNVECFLTTDCQEDVLLKILESIYTFEE